MKNLIGLSGLKRAGKDTAFECIRSLLPEQRVEQRALGDKVKELTGRALGYDGEGWTPSQITGEINYLKESSQLDLVVPAASLDPVDSVTMRSFIQDLGHGCREMFGEDFWIDQVLPKFSGHSPVGSCVDYEVHVQYPNVDMLIISDIRYPNEAERVLRLGGSIIEIVKPGLESDGKPSETPLSIELITARVINDAGKKELTEACRGALRMCGI